jgi:putative endonuclease
VRGRAVRGPSGSPIFGGSLGVVMHIFSSLVFSVVRWNARKGLRGERGEGCEEEMELVTERRETPGDTDPARSGEVEAGTLGETKRVTTGEAPKMETGGAAKRISPRKVQARRAGMRGETYAYWYLRNQGYVFVARNFLPLGAKGEIDLIGYDGATLAFVEVRTRTVGDGLPGLPELSVTTDKQRVVVRTAWQFLGEQNVGDCPCRFDVVAIDNRPGLPPVVRLHKDAFSPQF